MKWFKHDANASNDNKLAKLRIKYGFTGLGLYWTCLEEIAKGIDKSNLSFELEQDAEVLASWGGIDSRLCEEIMQYMVILGLFTTDATARIYCYSLARRIENSIVKSPQMKALQDRVKSLEFVGNPGLSVEIRDDSGKLGLDLDLDLDSSTTTSCYINANFSPNSQCLVMLADEGISRPFIETYLLEFRLFWIEAKIKKASWSTVFYYQCKKQFDRANAQRGK